LRERTYEDIFAITLLASSPSCFYPAPFVLAQVESGQIAGTVADQSGAIITGATVTVKNVATGAERTTQTSATGAYLVSGLEPASYQITMSSGAFKPFNATRK
jgi:hypothetical protein